jgi:alanine transaminase
MILELMIRDKKDAVLIPYPQYPLYSAAITLRGGTVLPYYPDEANEWAISIESLKQSLQQADEQGLCVRALCVITPGNPTGQVLDRPNQVELIKFAKEHDLVLVADEVYQANVYDDNKQFHSFKKVLCELGADYNQVPLFSLQSISKGFYGECGRRGGYMEVHNLDPKVQAQLVKAASINLCPNVNGQLCMAMVMWPPREGDESYPLYKKERDALLSSLKRRAKRLEDLLNQLEGVTCQPVDGALYAFPKISIPAKAAAKAKEMGKAADWLYCKSMLEETGIVVVPGSGFGQADGTYHFRTTILPSEDDIQEVCDRISKFHADFMKQYN